MWAGRICILQKATAAASRCRPTTPDATGAATAQGVRRASRPSGRGKPTQCGRPQCKRRSPATVPPHSETLRKFRQAGCKVQHALQQSVVASLHRVCTWVGVPAPSPGRVSGPAIGGPVPRRRLMYCPRSESLSLYRPKHAAPSLLLRLARQVSLAVVWTQRLIGSYPPPRHRRQPALVLSQRPWLAAAAVSAPYRLSPHPVFVAGQVRIDRGVLHARA
jgi:hypothetical protein